MQDTLGPVASRMAPDERSRFANIVGTRYALWQSDEIAGHLVERRGLYHGATPLVLKPGTTEEVSQVMALANKLRRPIVPQGGNTGLVGGQIPYESGGEVVLCLSRLDKIREVNPAANMLVAEAGVTLATVQAEADKLDRLFPLSLASEGTCQVGGNLSTNAGGMQVLAYGNARDLCLGLEVVLADGRVWNGLRSLRKDNTGYDLRDLFIGAEGTLGVITAAVLKLVPRPVQRASAFAGLDNLDHVAEFFDIAHGVASGALTRFELVPRLGVDLVLKHAEGSRDPLAGKHSWYVLLEISGHQADGSAERDLLTILENGLERGALEDAAVAASKAQEDAFWSIRERLSDVQGLEGGSVKNDIAVPVSDVPAFIRAADARIASLVPGARPVPFGHFGDGNIHYNVSQPIDMSKDDFIARWGEICGAVNEVALGFGGTISAEHGIGRMKRHLMPDIKSDVELDLMRAIKSVFDPNNILNPGKVL